jgi:hypothetical protein
VKAFNFTEGRIKGLQPRATGEATYRDTAVPGLELRVLASGARGYCVRYRLGGRGSPQRRLTLGAAGEMRLDDARKAALKALAEVRHGGDPVAERKAVIQARGDAAARTTVAELVDLHEAEQRARGVASAADAAKMLRRDFVAAVAKSRHPASVSRAELVGLLDRVRDGVPGHDAPRRAASRRSERGCTAYSKPRSRAGSCRRTRWPDTASRERQRWSALHGPGAAPGGC